MKASVVIPSYNACERLYYNLKSLNMQDYDNSLIEIIVVDNGSIDKTQEMLLNFESKLDIKTISLNRNLGRSKARNIGILNASGDIIVFSDSDMISDNNFITQHIHEHREKDMVVCGMNWEKIYTYYYEGFKGKQAKNFREMQIRTGQQYDIKYLKDKQCLIDEESITSGAYKKYVFTQSINEHYFRKVTDRHGNDLKGYNFPWSFFITNNCSTSKQNIVKAGMFDENFVGWGCEDLDLGFRLYKNECNFVKRDIRSIHQEHPVTSREDGINNIYIFTEKYDCLDVLLYYFGRSTLIDDAMLNEVVKDIHILEKVPKALPLLEIYRSIMKIVRNRALDITSNKEKLFYMSKNVKDYIKSNRSYFEKLCCDLKQEYDCIAFLTTFRNLTREILKIYV